MRRRGICIRLRGPLRILHRLPGRLSAQLFLLVCNLFGYSRRNRYVGPRDATLEFVLCPGQISAIHTIVWRFSEVNAITRDTIADRRLCSWIASEGDARRLPVDDAQRNGYNEMDTAPKGCCGDGATSGVGIEHSANLGEFPVCRAHIFYRSDGENSALAENDLLLSCRISLLY